MNGSPQPAPRLAATSARVALWLVFLTGCSDMGDKLTTGGSSELGPFRSAETCGSCHPNHLTEWESSMHAYAGSDPIMLRMAEMAAEEPGSTVGETCLPCHAPALVRQEQWLDTLPPEIDPPQIEDLSQDGINCDVCHSVSTVPPIGSIEFLDEVDPAGAKLAGLRDPKSNAFHESRFDNSFTTSIQCAACHQVNFDDGTGLENTYVEWEESILSGQGIECQDCHMPQYTGAAAVDAPVREDLHRHRFVGVDHALEPFRGIDREQQKAEIRDLLQSAVTVDVVDLPSAVSPGSALDFSIRVRNDRSGHSIPSGTSFARDMWIAVQIRDEFGEVLYESGTLEENGDLVSIAEDPQLTTFGSTMYDADGHRTLFTWRAVSIDESGLLPFNERRTAPYHWDVPTGQTGDLTLELSLRFRSLRPEMLRAIDLEELLPEIVIFNMWTETHTVAITP